MAPEARSSPYVEPAQSSSRSASPRRSVTPTGCSSSARVRRSRSTSASRPTPKRRGRRFSRPRRHTQDGVGPTGLVRFDGRRVVEFRPGVGGGKGDALRPASRARSAGRGPRPRRRRQRRRGVRGDPPGARRRAGSRRSSSGSTASSRRLPRWSPAPTSSWVRRTMPPGCCRRSPTRSTAARTRSVGNRSLHLPDRIP